MRVMKKDQIPRIDLSNIPETERTPAVKLLLSVIDLLQEQLQKQSNQLEDVLKELKRLKKLPQKPKLKASKLPKDKDDDNNSSSSVPPNKKRAGSEKRKKNSLLKVDKEEIIKAEGVPVGSFRKGYQDYVIQDLLISPIITKFRLERWQRPDGTYQIAKLPPSLSGHHFGPTLRAYILYQYHHQCVTQPLIHQQLSEWGIDISKGQLNRLLIEDKDHFHAEKASILLSGLHVSKYIHVDDTGARHQGKNGYCTHIGNELFAWFKSTKNKSRINFLELLRQSSSRYCLTKESFTYMKRYSVAPWIRDKLSSYKNKEFPDRTSWNKLLEHLEITNQHYIRLITEAALIGSILLDGFNQDMVILSDDAGQFNVFQHALCWIHAERGITTLIPSNEPQSNAIAWARDQIWTIYHLLLDYKAQPTSSLKTKINQLFNSMCQTKTDYQLLNSALKRMLANKNELLLVLNRPEIPLHNNLSERDIREYVKRRKISGSTRSDDGRKCRDTFTSLKKTAKKLKLRFWDYLLDRLTDKNQIPSLSSLIEAAAQ